MRLWQSRRFSLLGAAVLTGVLMGSPALAAESSYQAPALGEPETAVPSETSDDQLAQAQVPPEPVSGEGSDGPQNRAVSPIFSSRRGPLPDFLIGGFAEAGAAFSDRNSGSGSSFFSASFNPGLYFQYQDWLLFESELEVSVTEDGATETMLEFAQLDFLLHDNITLVVGKFLSPVGQFQERLHPAWINRLPNAPAGFGHDGLQPGSEVGAQVRGGIPFGRSRLTYALAVGNGPRIMEDGALMQEGFGGDDNGNKAISGRIGFLPVPFLEVGASFVTAKVRGMIPMAHAESAAKSAEILAEEEIMPKGPNTGLKIWGLDAAYTRGAWNVRAEFLSGTRNGFEIAPEMDGEEPIMVPRMKLRAWYAQAAYRLSGLTQHRILQNLEPVVRYGEYKIRGAAELAEENNEKRWDVGLNYWFAPSLVLHGAVEHRKFTARMPSERKDTRYLLQLGYGF